MGHPSDERRYLSAISIRPRQIWHTTYSSRSGPSHPRKPGVGTLFDRPKLVNVFRMLWGDFCLNLMDSGVVPNLAIVQLKNGAATTIGLLTGTAVS
jgi:hypothetical protein